MDTIDKLKQDVREGRISAEALIDLIADLCRKLDAANKRIEELEKQVGEGMLLVHHADQFCPVYLKRGARTDCGCGRQPQP